MKQRKKDGKKAEIYQLSLQKNNLRPSRPCPECGKMSQQDSYPFCSARCRAIDLNRWLSGAYILPPPPQKTDEEE
ncbi:DNA gyrase inhibitor YacG [Bartonella sp. C271]|uniref:DNA gyrase inhibitor YacG n=1 Tax=Bartonella sp. C271 TaxID=3070220 RepID=UPI0038B4B354